MATTVTGDGGGGESKSSAFGVVFRGIYRLRWFVIVGWLALAGAAAWPAMQFIGATSQTFTPPAGTPAAISSELFEAHFPDMEATVLIAVLVTRHPGDNRSVLADGFAQNLTAALRDQIVPASNPPSDMVRGVIGYYTLRDNYTLLADNFAAPDGRATIIAVPIYFQDRSANWISDFVHEINKWVASRADGREYRVEVTGTPALFHDIMHGTEADLATMDSIALPIALLVLTIVLSSLPMMIVPVGIVAIAFSLSFGVMYFVAKYVMDVAGFAPPVMMSVMIAMSFDYALFMLSRYREELDRCRKDPPHTGRIFYKPIPASVEDNTAAVEVMLRFAGRIVATSGLVLFACFLGMFFLPLSFVATFGLGAAVSLGFTIAINLTFVPAVLLVLRPLFSVAGFIPGIDFAVLFRRILCRPEPRGDASSKRRPFWRVLGEGMTKQPWGILAALLVLALLIPAGYWALHIRVSKDSVYMVPIDSSALMAFKHMQETSFSPGMAEPYKLIVIPKPGAPVGANGSFVMTPEFFEQTYQCLEMMCSQVGGLSEDQVIGVMLASAQQIDYNFAK
jgi:uncharacterized membrane protein YdfJ with MMPL/SSD domain